MSAGKKRGKRISSKPRGKKKPSRTGSLNWGEHVGRAKAAVAFRTGQFVGEHEDRIREAPVEDAARNSYLSGMLDMLTVARNVLGFWGADQIITELERSNEESRDRARKILSGPDPQGAPRERAPPGKGGPQGAGHATGRGPGKTAKALLRDPMFA